MMARVEKALWVGFGTGLLDAAFGLSALGFSFRQLFGVIVVIALHQLIAVVLAVGLNALTPELGDYLARTWREIRVHASGGDGEVGRALALVVWSLSLAVSWALAGYLMALLTGRFATALYEHILQAVVVVGVFATGAVISWRVAYLAKRLPFKGPLTRFRLGLGLALVSVAVYAALWVWRDLLFKEIHPVLGVILLMHGLGVLWAQWPSPVRRLRATVTSFVVSVLIVWVIGGWTQASPMLRRGAPASGVCVLALDLITDWDGDGVASHFGAQVVRPSIHLPRCGRLTR